MGLHDEKCMHLYIVIYNVIHVITIELLNGSFNVVATCNVYLVLNITYIYNGDKGDT